MHHFEGSLTYADGKPLIPGPLTLYTHVSEIGTVRHWHIDKMIAEARGKEVLPIVVEPEFGDVLMQRRGVEQHRLSRLQPHDLLCPVIFVEIEGEKPDDPPLSHLLVDGNHRYMRAIQLGWDSLPAVIFTGAEADKCRVLGLPRMTMEQVLTMPSGIA